MTRSFLFSMLLCLSIHSIAQQKITDSTAYIMTVNKAINYNNRIDSVTALIKQRGPSNELNTERNKLLYECLQIPIDYIKGYPNSTYAISALNMLGQGQSGSPISKQQLQQLFNALSENVKNSEEGKNYLINLKSWGNSIIRDKAQIAATSEKYGKMGYLDHVDFKNKLKSISSKQYKNVITAAQATIQIDQFLKERKPVHVESTSKKGKKLSDTEVYGKLKSATLIACAVNPANTEQFMKSTAYVIDETGIVITNYHVLNNFIEGGMSNFFMSNAGGEIFPVTQVLAASPIDDLAVLKIDTDGKKIPALSLGSYAAEGTTVYVMGHSDDLFYYFTKGMVSGNYSFTDNGFKHTRVLTHPIMTITADYAVGASGGPIVDEYGQVVGTISHTDTIFSDKTAKTVPQMILKKTIPVLALKELLNTQ